MVGGQSLNYPTQLHRCFDKNVAIKVNLCDIIERLSMTFTANSKQLRDTEA